MLANQQANEKVLLACFLCFHFWDPCPQATYGLVNSFKIIYRTEQGENKFSFKLFSLVLFMLCCSKLLSREANLKHDFTLKQSCILSCINPGQPWCQRFPCVYGTFLNFRETRDCAAISSLCLSVSSHTWHALWFCFLRQKNNGISDTPRQMGGERDAKSNKGAGLALVHFN